MIPVDDLPVWSSEWQLYTTWNDLPFVVSVLVLVLLLIVWWRQRSKTWFRLVLTTLLMALILAIASFYLFVVPPHFAGCPDVCDGWRGFPVRYARFDTTGHSHIAVVDFAINALILFMLALVAATLWNILGRLFNVRSRTYRWRILFVLIFVIAPWALLPRVLNPPQPTVEGEDLRLANNALRAAEFTYSITGLLILRLALEDMQRDLAPETIAALTGPTPANTTDPLPNTTDPLPPVDSAGQAPADTGESGQSVQAIRPSAAASREMIPTHLVCLRGYSYFFLPWSRYRIALAADGTTALSLTRLPLNDTCWQPPASGE